ncbi:hypothetical protein [Streptomyces griseorubiginosus]|uniref:hypothetical protein n=1 Tax=Streptomyces griseorubiginosus TaxID=67304 RepID=UPI0036E50C9B
MPTPSVGQIVHVAVDPAVNNGTDTAAAVICRVWSETWINVRVMEDGPRIEWRQGLEYIDALANRDRDNLNVWTWPPVVDDGATTEPTPTDPPPDEASTEPTV